MNDPARMHPPLDLVQALTATLQNAGFSPALGGSGLLLAHGLPLNGPAHDWDVTVDAELIEIAPILDTLACDWHDSTDGNPRFPSTRLAVVPRDGTYSIDLMLRFAVRSDGEDRPVTIPSLVDGKWNGLPLGSLPAWLVAYRLMGRPMKPEIIAAHLHTHGIAADQQDRLLAEPLPTALREELASFPRRENEG